MAEVVNINDVLDGHAVLDVECLDHIYLNAYMRHEALCHIPDTVGRNLEEYSRV